MSPDSVLSISKCVSVCCLQAEDCAYKESTHGT